MEKIFLSRLHFRKHQPPARMMEKQIIPEIMEMQTAAQIMVQTVGVMQMIQLQMEFPEATRIRTMETRTAQTRMK